MLTLTHKTHYSKSITQKYRRNHCKHNVRYRKPEYNLQSELAICHSTVSCALRINFITNNNTKYTHRTVDRKKKRLRSLINPDDPSFLAVVVKLIWYHDSRTARTQFH